MNENTLQLKKPQDEHRRVTTANAVQKAQDEQISSLKQQIAEQARALQKLQTVNTEQQETVNDLSKFISSLGKEKSLTMTVMPGKSPEVLVEGPMTMYDFRRAERLVMNAIRENMANPKLRIQKMKQYVNELKEKNGA